LKLDFNLHVHTWRSSCASPEMTLEMIERTAAPTGLRWIGLSDHIDRHEDNAKPEENRRDLSQRSWEVEFLVGCEATVISPNRMAVTDPVAEELDYVMVSANHYHLSDVENPDPRTPRGYAEHYLEMIEGVLDWGLADIVAHPFLHSKIRRWMDPLKVLPHYDWDRMESLMEESARKGLAFEIKPSYPTADPPFFGRLADLCREKGVKFSLGGDSHRPSEIAYPDGFSEELERVGIGEGDLVDPTCLKGH